MIYLRKPKLMRKTYHSFIFITSFILLLMAFSCSPKIYRDHQFWTGKLKPVQLDSLKFYLQQNKTVTLKDTIIIKYEFNHGDCSNTLISFTLPEVDTVIKNHNNYINSISKARPQVSIYQYREKGKSFGPYKSRNAEIKIDSGVLKMLLFKDPASCGTSAIVLPDGRYLLYKSDSHFRAIDFNKQEIEEALKR
jgi:hypothetical protein